jgi:hypothetical protein
MHLSRSVPRPHTIIEALAKRRCATDVPQFDAINLFPSLLPERWCKHSPALLAHLYMYSHRTFSQSSTSFISLKKARTGQIVYPGTVQYTHSPGLRLHCLHLLVEWLHYLRHNVCAPLSLVWWPQSSAASCREPKFPGSRHELLSYNCVS